MLRTLAVQIALLIIVTPSIFPAYANEDKDWVNRGACFNSEIPGIPICIGMYWEPIKSELTKKFEAPITHYEPVSGRLVLVHRTRGVIEGIMFNVIIDVKSDKIDEIIARSEGDEDDLMNIIGLYSKNYNMKIKPVKLGSEILTVFNAGNNTWIEVSFRPFLRPAVIFIAFHNKSKTILGGSIPLSN